MVWGWPELLQLLPSGVALVKAVDLREAAGCCWIPFRPTPSFGQAASWGRAFGWKAAWLGFIFFWKQSAKPPALCRVGLSENISLTVSSTYSSQPGGGDGPEEAIWHENEKRAKLLANLASGKEIGRENRKPISSESQVTPYSKLVQLLGKKPDKRFCSSADRFAKGALLPLKQQFPNLEDFHLLKSSLKWNGPSLISCLRPFSEQSLVLEIWRKRSSFLKVSRCLSGCQNSQAT